MFNYNPHPSPRAGVGQIIFPRDKVKILVEGIRKKKIEKLPDSCRPLQLSPRSKLMELRRERELKNHNEELLKNLER